VGRNRAAETAAYISPRIKKLVEDLKIKLMSYRDFAEYRRRVPAEHSTAN
jgi:hypothetical protein